MDIKHGKSDMHFMTSPRTKKRSGLASETCQIRNSKREGNKPQALFEMTLFGRRAASKSEHGHQKVISGHGRSFVLIWPWLDSPDVKACCNDVVVSPRGFVI
jgi:hypothetical protein